MSELDDWRSPPRELAMQEWWNQVNDNPCWSGALYGRPWDDLSSYDQADLWKIFSTYVHFGDT